MTDHREREIGRSRPRSGLAHEIAPSRRSRRSITRPPLARNDDSKGPLTALLGFADRVQDRSAAESAPPECVRQFVAFWVGGSEYALPIDVVLKVLRVDVVTRVPQAPPHVRGVTNVRGRVIPVFEISTRLGGEPVEIGPESCIVAVTFEGRTLGLLVDRASTVVSLPDSAIEPPPDDVLGASADYISGVGKHGRRIVILIELENILASTE